MSWKAGFWRLWIALSIFWIALTIWRSDPACPLGYIGIPIETGPWCDYRDAAFYWDLARGALSPPALGGLVIATLSWVASGFRQQDSN